MKHLLEGLLPRLFPGLEFQCIPHEGKRDLEKSLPRKLRSWREPGVRFVVLRDQDSEDCHTLKSRLVALAAEAGRPDTLVRLACRELEAWYLGDPAALAEAFRIENLRGLGDKARYRDPDRLPHPSKELARLVPEYQKIAGARVLAEHLEPERNCSRSFQVLLESLRALQAAR